MHDAPNPGLVFDMVNAFQRSAALRAGVELEVFAALGEGCSSVADLARRCQATERGVRILCDYLAIIGLVVKDGNRYYHSPTSAAFLDPRSPACIASIVHFLSNPEMTKTYDQLAQIVRQGRTVLDGAGTVEPDHDIWVDFAHHVAPMMAPMAATLGEAVRDGGPPIRKVLDIAAGHGLFGIEVAKQNPQADIVALDWAKVLQVAVSNARKAGIENRYQLKPGDAFDVDFEGPYDVILLTNFLHHFSKSDCEKILRKSRAALGPSGRVAALEFVPNPDRVSPPIPGAFALIMLATTAEGDAYTYPEYEVMFANAGFSRTSLRDVPRSPHRIVLGHVD